MPSGRRAKHRKTTPACAAAGMVLRVRAAIEGAAQRPADGAGKRNGRSEAEAMKRRSEGSAATAAKGEPSRETGRRSRPKSSEDGARRSDRRERLAAAPEPAPPPRAERRRRGEPPDDREPAGDRAAPRRHRRGGGRSPRTPTARQRRSAPVKVGADSREAASSAAEGRAERGWGERSETHTLGEPSFTGAERRCRVGVRGKAP